MKYQFLVLLFISLTSSLLGQSKDELKKEVLQLKNKITTLENELKSLKTIPSTVKVPTDYKVKYEELHEILGLNNQVFLLKAFRNKYTTDYFLKEPFEKLNEIQMEKIQNSNVIVRSILAIEDKNTSDYKIALQAKDFNQNFTGIDSIYVNVIDQKYSKLDVEKAIEFVLKLPKLQENSALDKEKEKLIDLLQKYAVENCLASNMYNEMYTRMQKFENTNYDRNTLKVFNVAKPEYTFLKETYNQIAKNYKYYEIEANKLPNSCENP